MVWPIDFLMASSAKRKNVNTLPEKKEEKEVAQKDYKEFIAELKRQTNEWYQRRPF